MLDGSASRAGVDAAPHLRVLSEEPIDLEAAVRAVSDLLVALGQDPSSEYLTGTPRRVAAALAESLTPTSFTLTTFANDGEYDEMVMAHDIPFHSLCAHHLLPFVGVAHVAYIPGERIVGISKLAQLVEHFARRLQTQEHLTSQVANALSDSLAPRGAGVVVEAEHLCMSQRGVGARGARTVTTSVTGLVRDDPATRAEFVALAMSASSGTRS
jgi:GTP cyclohydrolase IA